MGNPMPGAAIRTTTTMQMSATAKGALGHHQVNAFPKTFDNRESVFIMFHILNLQ